MSIGQELVRFGRALAGRPASREIERFGDPTFQAWADTLMAFQGQIYQPSYTTTYSGEKVERPEDTFLGYVHGAYRANGVIFAVSMARARPFSEVAFKFRRRRDSGGGPNLWGNSDLEILESPWPGGTTQSLMLRAEQDVTAAGTFFVAREDGPPGRPDRLRRLRPDWTEFILTAPPDQAVASDVVGLKYTAGGWWSGGPSRLYTLDEAAYWAPIPDPDSQYRGMSWISPIIDEFRADQAATKHKLAFFENAATPNLSVSLKESVGPDKFKQFVRDMRDATMGVENAYKTLYTGGGADVRVIGADMRQLDFAVTQGHGETRVAAAGGVPPIIVGLSEGLQAATYSNYGQAKRAYGDLFLRSQWRSFCGAIAPIVDVPDDSYLWYDSKDVAFLREDAADIAVRQSTEMATMSAGIAAGFEPKTVVTAVMADDWSKLKHTGMVSVQLQDPNATQPDPNAPPTAADGDGNPVADDDGAADDDALAAAVDQIGA
jgi:portal protein